MRPIYGCSEKFRESWLRTHGYFSRNLQWDFVPIDTKNVHTKLEVRSFTRSWDNMEYWKKFRQSLGPRYSHAPFSPKFLMGFCSHGPYEFTCQIWSSYSFTRFWDNKGHSKNLGSLWIRPRSLFSQIFHGLLFRCTLWMYPPNLQSV